MNTALLNCASVPMNNNFKSIEASAVLCNTCTFAVFSCTAQQISSTSGNCSWELSCKLKVVYSTKTYKEAIIQH